MSDESYLSVQDGKVTGYAGPDAVRAFQAIVISNALRFYAKTGMKMNSAYTPTAMLKVATSITGKAYKRTKPEYVRAADDLQEWADEMKAALPIVGR